MPENLSDHVGNFNIIMGPYGIKTCSPEAQYVFDGMVQLGRVTPEIHPWFEVTRADLNGLIDKADSGEIDNLEQYVHDQYAKWRPTAPLHERAHVSLSGLSESWLYLTDLITSVLNEVVDRYMGNSKPRSAHLTYTNMFNLPDNLYLPTEESISSDEVMDKIAESDLFNRLDQIFLDQCNNVIEDLEKLEDYQSFLSWRNNFLEQVRAPSLEEAEQQRRVVKPVPQKQDKRAKKALKKSIKIFEKFLGNNNLNAFLQGDSFTVQGKKYDYYISKDTHTSLLRHTANPTSAHIPYKLELYDKNGIYLAQSCLTFSNTPVLDQIVAFYLHIQAGSEDEMLDTMNFFNMTEEFRSEIKGDQETLDFGGITLDDIFGGPEDDDARNYMQYLTNAKREDVKRQLFQRMSAPTNLVYMAYDPPYNLDQITQQWDTDQIKEIKSTILSETKKLNFDK